MNESFRIGERGRGTHCVSLRQNCGCHIKHPQKTQVRVGKTSFFDCDLVLHLPGCLPMDVFYNKNMP